MNNLYKTFKEMKIFLILWLTQSFFGFGQFYDGLCVDNLVI